MHIPDGIRGLEQDLRAIFGRRLRSLVVYASGHGRENLPTPTLAVVDTLGADDLRACAARLDDWHDLALATPLVLAAHELERSLDAFPYEFGAILAEHVVVSGVSPFGGLRVDPADLRRACEARARSHLLHLREGYLETRGRGDGVADLILRSSAALTALVRSVARLQGATTDNVDAAAGHIESVAGLSPGSLKDVVKLSAGGSLSADEARRIFPTYLEAVTTLTNEVDRWNAPR